MITFETLKTEKVPLPPTAERKAKEGKAPRVTLASKLNEVLPHVNDSTFIAEAKKVNIDQAIRNALKAEKMSGKFRVVEYGIGGDSIYADKAGVRIWRTEAGKHALSVAAE